MTIRGKDAFLISKVYEVLRFITREIIEMLAEFISRIGKKLGGK